MAAFFAPLLLTSLSEFVRGQVPQRTVGSAVIVFLPPRFDLAARVLAERYTQFVAVYQSMGGGLVDIASSVNPRPADLAATAWPLR